MISRNQTFPSLLLQTFFSASFCFLSSLHINRYALAPKNKKSATEIKFSLKQGGKV